MQFILICRRRPSRMGSDSTRSGTANSDSPNDILIVGKSACHRRHPGQRIRIMPVLRDPRISCQPIPQSIFCRRLFESVTHWDRADWHWRHKIAHRAKAQAGRRRCPRVSHRNGRRESDQSAARVTGSPQLPTPPVPCRSDVQHRTNRAVLQPGKKNGSPHVIHRFKVTRFGQLN